MKLIKPKPNDVNSAATHQCGGATTASAPLFSPWVSFPPLKSIQTKHKSEA